MNRIDRLLGIILLLQGRRVTTAAQIAAQFELSVRTIYRDLAALSEIGVPVIAEAGVGYGLLKSYHLPPVMFSPEEAIALAFKAVYSAGSAASRGSVCGHASRAGAVVDGS